MILSFGIFLALFFNVESGWASMGFVIPVNIYAYCIVGYILYTIIYEYKQKNLHSPVIPFVEFALMYVYIVLHNTMVYASLSLLQPDAFIGVSSSFPRLLILKNMFFLATEITAALATGSIYADPLKEDGAGEILIFVNSIETILMFTIIGWGISRRIDRYTDKIEGIVRVKTKKVRKRKTKSRDRFEHIV